MLLGITLPDALTNIKRCIVQLIKVVDAVIKVDRYLLPCHKAEVPFLKERLVFCVLNPLYESNNVTLQIHQRIYVAVDFCLQVYDFAYSISHSGSAAIRITGHIRERRRAFGCQFI